MNELEQAARQAIHKINQATALDEESDELLMEAITALREALAEQADQEPDYFGLTHDHAWLSIDKKQYDKLKPEGRMACYAAPVHTVDLSDYEIRDIWHSADTYDVFCVEFARAVIAADREKNK